MKQYEYYFWHQKTPLINLDKDKKKEGNLLFRRYFRKKDPQCEAADIKWIEMSGKEYYRFVTNPENKGQWFWDMGDVVLECTEYEYKRYRAEDKHSSYILKQEADWITLSLNSTGEADNIALESTPGIEEMVIRNLQKEALRQAALQRPRLPTMVPLPSHSLKQWGQFGAILGGVRFPERDADRGPVLPPKLGGVVSNTGIIKTKISEVAGAAPQKTTGNIFASLWSGSCFSNIVEILNLKAQLRF